MQDDGPEGGGTIAAASKAAAGAPQPPPREVPILTAGAVLAVIMRAVFVLAGLFMWNAAFTISPTSAVHEIYQLNLVTGGFMAIGVAGIWAAIDALGRRR